MLMSILAITPAIVEAIRDIANNTGDLPMAATNPSPPHTAVKALLVNTATVMEESSRFGRILEKKTHGAINEIVSWIEVIIHVRIWKQRRNLLNRLGSSFSPALDLDMPLSNGRPMGSVMGYDMMTSCRG